MTEVFRHKDQENLLYLRVFGGVSLGDTNFIFECLYRILSNRYDYKIILHFENAKLLDNDFMVESARLGKQTEKYFEESYFVGLSGVQKFFFTLYEKFLPTKRIKRHVMDALSDVEKKLNISIQDFSLFASNSP